MGQGSVGKVLVWGEQRKARYLHRQIPKSTPNPRCARLRIWYKDARMRRRQIKEKVELTRQVNAAGFNQLESALLLFRLTASLHNVSVVDPAQSPTQPHSRQRTTLKRKRQTTTSQLRSHIGPLTPHTTGCQLFVRGLNKLPNASK